jgi:2-keto-4-pentenoate hydratase/2-oxohepta-3-ene-1,7-dioic acid hydratase in catechol pathway
MKIASYGPPGREKPGVLHNDRIIDLTGVDPSLPPTVRGILEAGQIPRIAQILDKATAIDTKFLMPLSKVRFGPPVTNPSKIICLGLNYKDHAEEQKREVPERPLLFAKAPSCLAGHGDPIPIPEEVEKLDHEVELAFVIGKRAKNIPIEEAPDYVAGYSVFMDISARDVQFREKQWFRGKSFDGFGPFGPYLTTADEIADPHNLNISMDVNGRTVQASNTGQMTFKVFFLVHYLSHSMTLEAGDVVATGTPAGVGVFASPPRFLQKNDTLEATIEGLGTLVNPVETQG